MKKSRMSLYLGIAFLLQAITAALSKGLFMDPYVVKDNISETMINIAENSNVLYMNILGQMITAMGIVFLGAMLYIVLKKHNKTIATIAFGFYILEAGLIAVSRIDTFNLIQTSKLYVDSMSTGYLEVMGKMTLDAMNYTYALHMLPFCIGAGLFYYILLTSKAIPKTFSFWGLITLVLCLVATLIEMFGTFVPIYVYLPYAPFEFIIGIWILVKGINMERLNLK
jgi:hypothetical protein